MSTEETSKNKVETWEQERKRCVDEAISRIPDEPEQIDAIAKIRGWFSPPEEELVYYDMIQAYLNGEKSLVATIEAITTPIDGKVSTNNLEEEDFSDHYRSIIHSAQRIPYTNNKGHKDLVELMKALKDKLDAESHQETGTVTYLRDFGLSARESMNDSPGCGSGYSIPEIHAYANFHYFLALLTRSEVVDFWLYGIWAMRDALENDHTDDRPNDAHVTATAIQKYDAFVPAAAMWVFALGEELYTKEQDMSPTNPNQGNPARGGARWRGMAGFSKERYSLWKKRFQEISSQDGIAAETREIAKEAFKLLNQYDGHQN